MTWFEILQECRKLARKQEFFTSEDIVDRGVDGGKLAAAWLSKFEKWGYVRRTGKIPGGKIRWELTDWGEMKYAPTGPQAVKPAFEAPERVSKRAANPKKGKRGR